MQNLYITNHTDINSVSCTFVTAFIFMCTRFSLRKPMQQKQLQTHYRLKNNHKPQINPKRGALKKQIPESRIPASFPGLNFGADDSTVGRFTRREDFFSVGF